MEWRRPRGIRVERKMPRSAARLLFLLVSPQSHGRARSICPQMGERNAWRAKKSSRCSRPISVRERGRHALSVHGTNQPSSIGQAVSSGCVRMLNTDIIELYDLRVSEGTKVVVIATPRKTTTVARAMPRKQKLRKIVRREPKLTFAFSVRVWPRFDRTLQQRRWHSSPNSSEKPISI